jgi:hypothetical protein
MRKGKQVMTKDGGRFSAGFTAMNRSPKEQAA